MNVNLLLWDKWELHLGPMEVACWVLLAIALKMCFRADMVVPFLIPTRNTLEIQFSAPSVSMQGLLYFSLLVLPVRICSISLWF